MQIKTIRIKAEPSSDNELGFVTINLSDFNPEQHQPFDEESVDALKGAVKLGELVPPADVVLAAREELEAQKRVVFELEQSLRQRESELTEREQTLVSREAAVAEREQANAAEAQRLAEEKAASAKAAAGTEGDSIAASTGKTKK